MGNRPTAFLSYTRVDDEFFGGAITALRHQLELGVQVVTGRSFHIFQDIDGIEIGQQWQKRLDEEVSEAIFMIPIITPSFLNSSACRDEVSKFLQREKSLGRDDLILPIYFVTAPLLEKADLLHADSVALEIKKRQRYDWRSQADWPITDARVRPGIIEISEKIAVAIARAEVTSHPLDVNRLRSTDFHNASKRIFIEETAAQSKREQTQLLWVDDNPDNNIYERSAMEAYSIKFVLSRSTEDALREIESLYKTANAYFDVIISDMGRPPDYKAGFTLLEALRARGNQTPYFIYCGHQAAKYAKEALRRGAQGITNVPGELIDMVLTSIRVLPKKALSH